jgi:hypothetical protein
MYVPSIHPSIHPAFLTGSMYLCMYVRPILYLLQHESVVLVLTPFELYPCTCVCTCVPTYPPDLTWFNYLIIFHGTGVRDNQPHQRPSNAQGGDNRHGQNNGRVQKETEHVLKERGGIQCRGGQQEPG